jgi:protein O-GlcNAc transferase
MVIIKFPQNPIDCHISALEFMKRGDPDKAIAYYRIAINMDPKFTKAYVNLGVLLKNKGKIMEAKDHFDKAIKINPKEAYAYSNLGNIYRAEGRNLLAENYYKKAIKFNKKHAESYNNLGVIYQLEGDLKKAKKYYNKAINLNAKLSESVYSNLGSVLMDLKELDNALLMSKKATDFKNASTDSFFNLGNVYSSLNDSKKAISAYKKAVKKDPDNSDALNRLVEIYYRQCKWTEYKKYHEILDKKTDRALVQGGLSGETPFTAIVTHDDPERSLQIAKSWSNDLEKQTEQRFSYTSINKISSKSPIRVGYVSANFSNHPVGHIIKNLFVCHDKKKFRIYIYDYSPKDKSGVIKKIRGGSEVYRNITKLNLHETAKLIRKDKINILVDLMGYTRGNRLGIFAERPAPVQMTYLGFPGSLGADFIDYNIVDKVLVPKSQEKYYSEKLIYIPGCYQVNDSSQRISDRKFRRKDFGLPENVFIFGSFNRLAKITEEVFDVWMRTLKKVKGSVLWLPGEERGVILRLKREALKRDVSAKRLIFSKKLPLSEHIKRLQLADLMLDTYPYSGGATTSHALRVGVPVLTLAGKSYLSRMSASLLRAAGVAELIVDNFEDYERLAVNLAKHEKKMKNYREKLAGSRHVKDIFNTQKFVRNLEKKFLKIVNGI